MSQAALVPSVERLLALVDGLAGQPVVMLADLVVDRFVLGSPKRISREAPVLILRYEGETQTPGGGANAIANLRSLGGEPLPLGLVGEDASGDVLLAELGRRGIETSGIARLAGYRTPTKTRILGGGPVKQQIVRYDIEDHATIGAVERAQFAAALGRWRDRARVAVLSDYGYGAVEPDLVPALREALGAGGLVLCDSRWRLARFAGVDGATPNQEEAEALLGSPLGDEASLGEGGRELGRRLGVSMLVVTRGSRGLSLFAKGVACHIPVHGTDQVADVTGAGDTVIAAFALALAAGATPLEAALLADYAAGVVVMRMGTATLTPAELAAAVRADPRPREELRWVAS
ncbi:MAG: bifunctional heptose 7-phosphate kinase/heptose 1-phosphate adenyltransferase [Thermoanaerobaculia bacterium]